VLLAVFVSLALIGGCGGSSDPSPSPERYLLTTASIDQVAAKSDNPAAVKSTLDFWRAVQFQTFGDAYNLLTRSLRSRIPYDEFLDKLGPARYVFLARPQVYDLAGKDPATVFLVAPQGDTLTDNDQVIGFTLTREDGQWRIGSDPFNVFHEQSAP